MKQIPSLNTAALPETLKYGAWKFLGLLLIFRISHVALRVPEDL